MRRDESLFRNLTLRWRQRAVDAASQDGGVNTPALRAIALARAAKAMLVLSLAAGAAHGHGHAAAHQLDRMGNAGPGAWQEVMHSAAGFVAMHNTVLLCLLLALAGIHGAEAWGLWHGRRWASRLVVVGATMLLPLEAAAVWQHASATRVSLPPRQNSCRASIHQPRGGHEGRTWLDTDRHRKTERWRGCCRRRAQRSTWLRARLGSARTPWSAGPWAAGSRPWSPLCTEIPVQLSADFAIRWKCRYAISCRPGPLVET